MASFASRLAAGVSARGRLCVGIDPHAWLLQEWALPDTAAGAREFGLRVIDAAAGRVAVVKPQVAFYERFGSAGYAALEDVLAAARAASLLVIADAKRGDIGSSLQAYVEGWLTPGSPLEADALTVNAYQGVASLDSAVELAQHRGKGLFLLAATSNPEAAALQQSMMAGGATVAAEIVRQVAEINEKHEPGVLGSVGVVLGATVRLVDFGIDPQALRFTPILAPGFGYQGARTAELESGFGSAAPNVIANVSRSILSAGPEALVAAIETEAAACRV